MANVAKQKKPTISDTDKAVLREAMDMFQPDREGNVSLKQSRIWFEFAVYGLTLRVAQIKRRDASHPNLYHYVQESSLKLGQLPYEEQTFERLLELIEAQYTDGRPVKGIAYSFMNINNRNAPEHIDAGGNMLARVDPSALLQKLSDYSAALENQDFRQAFKLFEPKHYKFTPYSYPVQLPAREFAGSLTFAPDIAAPFARARSLLNYLVGVERVRMYSGVNYHTMAEFLPSPLIIVEREDKIEDAFIYDRTTLFSSRINQVSTTLETWSQYNQLQQKLHVMPVAIATVIYRLLEMYQRGLDAAEESSSFLHFWQVAEQVVSPDRQNYIVKQEEVIRRLGALLSLREYDRVVLKELGDIRNNYVHTGYYPDASGERYPRLMKTYAGLALHQFLFSVSALGDLDSIDAYLNLMKNPKKVEGYRNALSFIDDNVLP